MLVVRLVDASRWPRKLRKQLRKVVTVNKADATSVELNRFACSTDKLVFHPALHILSEEPIAEDEGLVLDVRIGKDPLRSTPAGLRPKVIERQDGSVGLYSLQGDCTKLLLSTDHRIFIAVSVHEAGGFERLLGAIDVCLPNRPTTQSCEVKRTQRRDARKYETAPLAEKLARAARIEEVRVDAARTMAKAEQEWRLASKLLARMHM